MELKQLEALVRVAELGSFSRAAMLMRLPQPSLSRYVRGLEVELRETLFTRTGRGVQLTDAGKRLYEHAAAIVQLAARARDEVAAHRGRPVGRVVVGMPPSVGRQLTPALVERFKVQCPDARLTVVEALSAYLGEWIATGRTDLALLHNPEPNESIEIQPLLEEPLCLVTPMRSGRARQSAGAPLPLRELSAYPLVVPDLGNTIRRFLETQAARAGIRLDVALEVSSIPTIIDLVARGYGCAVLTASAVAISGRGDRLTLRPLVEPQLMSTLCLATSAKKRKTPLVAEVSAILSRLVGSIPR
jgi:LysR family transcriptional regulator, nitrogen assimilation regulatory protein